jgi:hypothetical protein
MISAIKRGLFHIIAEVTAKAKAASSSLTADG